jgi:hypothetical protein
MMIYTPITLTNSQSAPTPAPFQQMIQAPITFRDGVRFLSPTDGWLLAWLESIGSDGTATIWVKIPSSIPAGGTYRLYMIQDSTLPIDGVYWGEAPQLSPTLPQLSPTYGAYDNGANVFNFYDNFAGTSLNAKLWNVSAATGYTVNNGLTVNPGGGVTSYAEFSQGVFETYGNITPGNPSASWWGTKGFGLAANRYFVQISDDPANGSILDLSSGVPGASVWPHWMDHGGVGVWSIIVPSPTSTVIYGQFNYSNTVSTEGKPAGACVFTNPLPIAFIPGSNRGVPIGPFNWVRARAYPPNGVMPAVSLGASQYSGMLIPLR